MELRPVAKVDHVSHRLEDSECALVDLLGVGDVALSRVQRERQQVRELCEDRQHHQCCVLVDVPSKQLVVFGGGVKSGAAPRYVPGKISGCRVVAIGHLRVKEGTAVVEGCLQCREVQVALVIG